MSIKKVAGITALITAMAFVNSANDLTIVGDNNVCYAKVVRRVTRNVVIQKNHSLLIMLNLHLNLTLVILKQSLIIQRHVIHLIQKQ